MSTEDTDLMRLARRRVIAKNVYLAVVAGWAALVVVQIGIWWLTTPDGYFWPA